MQDAPTVEEFEVEDPTHGPLPAIAVRPKATWSRMPLVLFLYGGGGDLSNLRELAGLVDPRCVVACVGVPPWCFYLDDPARAMAWETAVADTLRTNAQRRYATDGVGLVGISMGGYGALKIALARPTVFAAVAAVAPIMEPSWDPALTRPRNRFFYPPSCPPQLFGSQPDAALWRRDHPAHRALAHHGALRATGLPIRIDAGSRDAVHAHDGAEFLHRVLWDLDLAHHYVLHRDADHVGPSVAPRLRSAFAWVAQRLRDSPPTVSAPAAALRNSLAEARAAAAVGDPTVVRQYGRLPAPVPPEDA